MKKIFLIGFSALTATSITVVSALETSREEKIEGGMFIIQGELDPLDTLVDLNEPYGLNLNLVNKRQTAVRQRGIGDDVSSHILLLQGNLTKIAEQQKILNDNARFVEKTPLDRIPQTVKLQLLKDDKKAKETIAALQEVQTIYITKILAKLGKFGLTEEHLKNLPPL